MNRADLGSGWTVRPADPSEVPAAVAAAADIPATVPGSVHTDLLAAGLIDDPYLDDNEALQAWIGQTDWVYTLRFDWADDGSDRQELVFGGIDTVAAVTLDGEHVASTINMHRSYRFDVTDSLTAGAHELVVHFSSPVRAADAASLALGYRTHVNHHPYNAIRKMACSFGWDWGIDTATSGLWKPARLETWSSARFADIRIAGSVVDGTPTVTGLLAIESAGDVALEAIVRINGREWRLPIVETEVSVELPVPDAQLWWPLGHGEPVLYEIEIDLVADGVVVDSVARRVGFRDVRIDTQADGTGTAPFTILVNGEVILVRGVNWIPDDAFPHRVDRARYADRLSQAEFAGVNLVRVWGGGIYESDDFFDECDERGLLVWQDFLFACAAYAEEEPLRSEVEAEAREAITRLAVHPSLVVLNGNNENLWGRQEWGWELRLDGRTWGEYYYYDLFPALVAHLAPHVAYTPGSPFSPDRDAVQNDEHQGSMHIWDVWNEKDYAHYRDYKPRFVAEFGWQGPPSWSTLRRSVSDNPLTPESPGMLVHQKAASGNFKLSDGLLPHLRLPDDIDEWHWAMSLNQAVAIRTGVEWFRSLTPLCTGAIVWQLNDNWPVTSWSALDGDGRRKPLLFALRHAHADRLVTIQPSNDGLSVALIADTASDWAGRLTIERLDFSGAVLASSELDVHVAARGAVTLPIHGAIAETQHPEGEVLVARVGDHRALWFFAEYRDSALAASDLAVSANWEGEGWRVDVVARTLVRDLTLLVDRIDPTAQIDNGMVTLLPGEKITFTVQAPADIDPGGFSSPLVLRSANDLVQRPL